MTGAEATVSRTLNVRLTLGPIDWFHGRPPPRRGGRPTTDRPVRRPPAAAPCYEARGGALAQEETDVRCSMWTRTPRAVASARSAARRSPRSGSVSRPRCPQGRRRGHQRRGRGRRGGGRPRGCGRVAARRVGAARREARAQRRQPVPAGPGRDDCGAAPRQRHLPRRRDRQSPACRVPPRGRRLLRARRRQPQRHLRQPRAGRRRHPAGGDEVQIGKFRLVYLTGPRTGRRPLASGRAGRPTRVGGLRAGAARGAPPGPDETGT